MKNFYNLRCLVKLEKEGFFTLLVFIVGLFVIAYEILMRIL